MEHVFQGKDASHASQDNQGSPDLEEKRPGTRLLPETTWADEPMPTGIPPEDKVVVTISRQFGSGGSDIAQLVTSRAGLNYIDQRLIADVGQRMGTVIQQVTRHDEQTRGIVEHILEAIQVSNPLNASYYTLHGSSSTLAHTYELASLRLTQRVI